MKRTFYQVTMSCITNMGLRRLVFCYGKKIQSRYMYRVMLGLINFIPRQRFCLPTQKLSEPVAASMVYSRIHVIAVVICHIQKYLPICIVSLCMHLLSFTMHATSHVPMDVLGSKSRFEILATSESQTGCVITIWYRNM